MPRIAILGRPGPARDHLRRALEELGGDIALEGDPDECGPDRVAAASPSVLVFSLDTEQDEQLDRWEPLFATEGLTVVFDEAETTCRLDGWDLARWARHLASKILGEDNTLPPLPAGAEALPDPVGLAMSPASGGGTSADHADFGVEFAALEDDVPIAKTFAGVDCGGDAPGAQEHAARHAKVGSDGEGGPGPDRGPAPTRDTGSDGGTASAQAFSAPLELLDDPVTETDPGKRQEINNQDTPADDGAGLRSAQSAEAGTAVSGLRLEATDDELAARGVVLLLSGMGGPDALRQFLSALPGRPPVPLLLYQHLNAGTHERLAAQLAKTAPVPTYVAAPGAAMPAGAVGILPPGVGVASDPGLCFISSDDGPAGLVAGIVGCRERAIVVVLSGAESGWLEHLEDARGSGVEFLVQSPESCFDPAACAWLVERGIDGDEPPGLAARLGARWPHREEGR